ncbi:MAG: carbamoyltransferase N-terminal domain-containing protein, partial [Candidatus Methanomethylicaceae archaeon]
MVILGINAFHGDASAAIIKDGELIAAVEEERFTRIKHESGFPKNAIRYCLKEAGVRPEEIDHIAIPRKRTAHLLQKAFWALRVPELVKERAKVWQKVGELRDLVADALEVSPIRLKAQFHYIEHHLAHVASSFYVSPFREAALLSIDGLGDFASLMWGVGRDTHIEVKGFVLFPHSLGFLYTAVTQFLGFWKYGDEYKVMGLAAYGQPRFADFFNKLIEVRNNSIDFSLGLKYFVHHKQKPDMAWEEGEPSFGALFSSAMEEVLGPARKPGEPITERHQDIAASLQARTEEVIFALLNELYRRTQIPNLCYAGGVAFNCVANGKIRQRTPFREVYIQPAAGDAGLALGSAYYVYHQELGYPRGFVMEHAYWGPGYSG